MGKYDAYAKGPAYEAAVAAWDDATTLSAGQGKAEAALIEGGYSPYGPELVAEIARDAGDIHMARLTPAMRALTQAAMRIRPPHATMEP
jgi:hypothetical protein